jgi:hypothetical protein
MADVPIPAFQGETHMSTSGDIHLYIDPCTATHGRPLLYADSEGLRGVVTMASIAGASAEASMSGASGLTDYEDDLYSEDIGADIRREHIPQPCSEPRTIAWAKNERSDRGYIVDHLYPRFLYTFSDVVVFVTKDPKTRKSDTEQLLDWASLGYETTLNQRTPPVCIHQISSVNPPVITSPPGPDHCYQQR